MANEKPITQETSNTKSIIQEITEIKTELEEALKSINNLVQNPGYKRVMDFMNMMDAFTNGAHALKPGAHQARKRRTKEQIEVERLAKEGGKKE